MSLTVVILSAYYCSRTLTLDAKHSHMACASIHLPLSLAHRLTVLAEGQTQIAGAT